MIARTCLFEEPGMMDVVFALARAWFLKHLAGEEHDAVH